MSETLLPLLFVLVLLVSAGLAAPIRRWLERERMFDLPGERRSHRRPTPRGGGLAIVLALVVAWLFWPGALIAWWPAMVFVAAMAAVGWIEDRRELAPRWRLLVQAVAAAGLMALVGGVDAVDVFGARLEAPWLWSALGVVALVWLINLYNFMDGSDGLAAGQGLWAGALAAFLFVSAGQLEGAMLAAAMAGAWGGFLFWNRPPARVFMGDTGSAALGAAVGALALLGAVGGAFSVWIAFMISATFVVDATATLAARLGRGERWYTAHRQHAYQRMLDLGFSHGQVLGGYMLVNFLLVLPVVALALRWPRLDTALAAGLTIVLLAGWWMVQSAASGNNDKA